MMRKLLLMTAAVLAAVIVFVLATLPPNPARVDLASINPDLLRRTVSGAYHIHTTRSDGAGTKDAIAAAAGRAGLQFAIFTDHGDGTRTPDPPSYVGGVLCIDGVEISTNGGHYVALDLPAAPYPLGGEAAAVVEDVKRLGGFGIAAHPDSPKRQLAWTDWTAPIDGFEWLNVDSEWRDESRPALVEAALHYLVRPPPAIASILDRPQTTLQRWDERLMRERPVVALAAVDAHGGMHRRLEGAMPAGVGPSYEASFHTVSNRVLLEGPFTGDAASDARLLMAAIRRGRIYTVVDAIATPGFFAFDQAPDARALPEGSRVVRIGPKEFTSRYEVYVPGGPGSPPVPWLLANPAVFPRATVYREPYRPAAGGAPLDGDWRVEKDPRSTASIARDAEGVVFDYQLASGDRTSQFAALAIDLAQHAAIGEVVFDAAASKPMRVSVQLRFPGAGDRWVRSVYVDPGGGTGGAAVSDMVAADGRGQAIPDTASAGSLLFVVDLTNASPGAAGRLTIRNVRLTAPPAVR
jgi:hypothetical protein